MKVWKKLLIVMAAFSCALFAFGCGTAETPSTDSASNEPNVSDSTGGSDSVEGETPDGHVLTVVKAKEETCTEDGNVQYYSCSHCDKYFVDANATLEISAVSVVIKARHRLTKTNGVEATCTSEGSIEYYTCSRCEKHFSDSQGKNEIELGENIIVPAMGHSATKVEATDATCTEDGNVEHYACSTCGKFYLDEACENELSKETVLLPAGHNLTYHEATAPSGKTNGNIEYWSCSVCENSYATEACIGKLTEEDIVILSALNIPDFLVEVEEGRDPVVLQLSDTQTWSWGAAPEEQCYKYVREVVGKTNPDLIIVTGDLVYGRFDPNGSLLKSLIAFMETLDTLWAPVFGNHDNESLMGVDWQCAQLEAAENCLFKQGDVTGNGNYSVGIAQGDELLRVFYMMDSNGCGAPMVNSDGVHTAPAPGTNVVKTSQGFGQDQVDWYTNQINAIHKADSDVKISFAYHIQQSIFQKVFTKYEEYDGLTSNSALINPLNLDTMETADETDFGYLGRPMKGGWDGTYEIYKGMKALGADSIFVGHEHCNSASIVYDGVRFQYGQKSSTYDRYNSVSADGTITGNSSTPAGAHPLLGGTVIPISSVDGSIGTGYICYAGDPFNFEPEPEPVEVNGLQMSKDNLQSGKIMTLEALAFDDTVNAYKITSGSDSAKFFFDPAMAAKYKYFTFNVYIPADSTVATGAEFYLRVKPDGVLTSEHGSSDGKYIVYSSTTNNALRKVNRGAWTKVTVDISVVDSTCTDFNFMFSTGTVIWFRDIAFTDTLENTESGEPTVTVNGLQYGGVAGTSELWIQNDQDGAARGSIVAEEYTNSDGTKVGAYKLTSSDLYQKLHINPALLKGKTTVSFSILITEEATDTSGKGTSEFALRIKPNQTEDVLPNVQSGYVYYDVNASDYRKVTLNEWMTVTVDISAFADECTEFSIYLIAGNNSAYVKDITVS